MRRPDYGGSGLPCAALMGDRPQVAEIERMRNPSGKEGSMQGLTPAWSAAEFPAD
jgi:hypothetical protein